MIIATFPITFEIHRQFNLHKVYVLQILHCQHISEHKSFYTVRFTTYNESEITTVITILLSIILRSTIKVTNKTYSTTGIQKFTIVDDGPCSKNVMGVELS